MSDLLTVIGSVTTASRLKRELERRKITAAVVHTPTELGNSGCSYSIKTKRAILPVIIELAEKYKIKVKGFFIIEETSNGAVYHDIS